MMKLLHLLLLLLPLARANMMLYNLGLLGDPGRSYSRGGGGGYRNPYYNSADGSLADGQGTVFAVLFLVDFIWENDDFLTKVDDDRELSELSHDELQRLKWWKDKRPSMLISRWDHRY